MPIYDYECKSCGQQFEKLCKGEELQIACPYCMSMTVERKISCPSPLKKGAFPFKPGKVHPLGKKMAAAMRGQSPAPTRSCSGACGLSSDD